MEVSSIILTSNSDRHLNNLYHYSLITHLSLIFLWFEYASLTCTIHRSRTPQTILNRDETFSDVKSERYLAFQISWKSKFMNQVEKGSKNQRFSKQNSKLFYSFTAKCKKCQLVRAIECSQ